MSSWKEDYREKKEDSGLTWNDFVRQRMVHVDEIPETELEAIRKELEAVKREYRDLKREVHEVRVLAQSDEFGEGENK